MGAGKAESGVLLQSWGGYWDLKEKRKGEGLG